MRAVSLKMGALTCEVARTWRGPVQARATPPKNALPSCGGFERPRRQEDGAGGVRTHCGRVPDLVKRSGFGIKAAKRPLSGTPEMAV